MDALFMSFSTRAWRVRSTTTKNAATGVAVVVYDTLEIRIIEMRDKLARYPLGGVQTFDRLALVPEGILKNDQIVTEDEVFLVKDITVHRGGQLLMLQKLNTHYHILYGETGIGIGESVS